MPTLSSRLRDAVNADGRSTKQIAIAIDLDYRQLSRFLRQERTLSQGAIDRLAAELGLELLSARKEARRA